MAFAPVDVWWRMLSAPRVRVAARYWPRMLFAWFTSVLATLLTLPERVVLGLWRPWRRGADTDVVVVLGYYRTGTTHLHYLMSCDPKLRTPAWCETLAPQGYAVSWGFLRLFMIPFVSARRPQDDVAIGPGWPAEDDFAINNWALASSLPGRFVVPDLHEHYGRFHDLKGLTDRELSRWRECQKAFVWKIASLGRGRAVLLKTPSHTARVAELAKLFGERVKFVHISRDPAAVIRSNVNMAARLSVYNLQDPPQEDEVRRRVVNEYLRTERKYMDEAAAQPHGHLVEMRYEDLVADPMGQLRRIYDELGLSWTTEFESRARAYLASVRDYRAADRRDPVAERVRAKDEPASDDSEREEAAAIRGLIERFGHDQPAIAKVEAGSADAAPTRGRWVFAAMAGLVTALLAVLLWMVFAYLVQDRHDWLIWPVGVLIGWSTIRAARAGSVRLGVWAAVLTVGALLMAAWPVAFLEDYAHRAGYVGWWRGDVPTERWEWYHINKSARVGLLSTASMFWVFMGVVTAYRFASRRYVDPPGSG